MIAGGGVLALTAQKPSEISTIAGNSTDLGDLLINGTAPVAKARSYRQYSDEEIK